MEVLHDWQFRNLGFHRQCSNDPSQKSIQWILVQLFIWMHGCFQLAYGDLHDHFLHNEVLNQRDGHQNQRIFLKDSNLAIVQTGWAGWSQNVAFAFLWPFPMLHIFERDQQVYISRWFLQLWCKDNNFCPSYSVVTSLSFDEEPQIGWVGWSLNAIFAFHWPFTMLHTPEYYQ